MADGRFFRTEDAVIRRIFVLSRYEGCWPGYVKVDGGYRTTFEPDELAPLPGDDGQAGPDDDDGDDYGPWDDDLDADVAA